MFKNAKKFDALPLSFDETLSVGIKMKTSPLPTSTISGHILNIFKWSAGKGSSINKNLVFKRYVSKNRISHFLIN